MRLLVDFLEVSAGVLSFLTAVLSMAFEIFKVRRKWPKLVRQHRDGVRRVQVSQHKRKSRKRRRRI